MPIDLPCFEIAGLVPLYLLGFAYLFLACYVLTEDFFVPSLEKLAFKWRLSKDVAGATLMALGSSGPEIAVNIIDTVFGEEDLGILSVVGSAMFNICFITAMSIFFAPFPIEISPKPFIRDFVFYFIAMISLTVAVNDYKVEMVEAFGLLALYVIYVTFLLNQHHLFKWIDGSGHGKSLGGGSFSYVNLDNIKITADQDARFDIIGEDEEEYTVSYSEVPLGFDLHPCPNDTNAVVGKLSTDFAKEKVHTGSMLISVNDLWLHGQSFEFACEKLLSECENLPVTITFRRKKPTEPKQEARGSFLDNPYNARKSIFVSMGQQTIRKYRESQDYSAGGCGGSEIDFSEIIEVDKHHHLDGSSSDPLEYHDHTWFGCCFHYAVCPIETVMGWTIPKSLYLSFVGCIAWILCISYMLTQLTKLTGCALRIDMVLMGMIFLAGGTSVPDMLCSIAVAKQMEGDMCISNISGSNISNVLLGIGMPWFIETIVTGEPHKPEVEKLNYYLGFLLCSQVLSLILFVISRFNLKNCLAIIFLILYVCFVSYVVYIDLFFETDEEHHETSHEP